MQVEEVRASKYDARRGSQRPIWLYACMICGDRVDEIIRFHRLFARQETTAERNERIMRSLWRELALVEAI